MNERMVAQRKKRSMQGVETNSTPVNAVPSLVHNVLDSLGQPLDEGTRAFMKPRFGHDFSQVRLHTDERAVESAETVNALAYTVGQDVVFGEGQYVPGTSEGKRLLAHELTHVVQQSQIGFSSHPSSESMISDPVSSAENEASAVANQVMDNQQTRVNSIPEATIQRVIHGTRLDPNAPEETYIDATGHYEAIYPGGNNRITVQINQAGYHIEGWWQRRLYSENSGQRLEIGRIVGDLSLNEPESVAFRYQRFVGRGTPTNGSLTVTKSGTNVQMSMYEGDGSIITDDKGVAQLQGWSHQFTRTSTESHLSDEAIQAVPDEVRSLVQASENAPLDTSEEKRIADGCKQILSFIQEYLDATRESVVRASIASGMNEYINNKLMGTYAPAQMPLVIRRIREFLVNPTLASGSVTRPYWDWLQVIVSSQPSYTKDIQKRLDMSPAGPTGPDAPQHRYRWMFSTVGLSPDLLVGIGGFLGVFVIEKLAPDQWTTKYFTVMGNVSGGLSAGVTVGQTTDWDYFETPFAWTTGNFRGAYAISGTSGGAAAVAGPGYTAVAFVNFYGDGTFPVLSGDASGLAAIYGLVAGATLGITSGYLWGGQEEAIRSAAVQKSVTGQSDYKTSAEVHFVVDDPSLTNEGHDAIRQMCALHRAALENPNSTLAIDGYTSTTGTVERNQLLSTLRAQNTFQAIHDILGSTLAIPDAQIHVEGHGKTSALQAGEPDNTENPIWRKVEVQLNGQVVLTLR
jgi:outer membrane protein OmpA-like peptidoglycan-associated protein